METKVLRDTIENKDISPVVMSNTVYHKGLTLTENLDLTENKFEDIYNYLDGMPSFENIAVNADEDGEHYYLMSKIFEVTGNKLDDLSAAIGITLSGAWKLRKNSLFFVVNNHDTKGVYHLMQNNENTANEISYDGLQGTYHFNYYPSYDTENIYRISVPGLTP